MDFEWDIRKEALNIKKHGIHFAEASTVFSDPAAGIFDDPKHSLIEKREIIIGFSSGIRCLVVSFTVRGFRIRIISARRASKKERGVYEDYKKSIIKEQFN